MPRRDPIDDALTYSVIGAFFEVYNTLGFGFLEHIYVQALEYELRSRGHRVARQVRVVVYYKGLELAGQRLDLIVDETLVVETKSTYHLHPAATRQLVPVLKQPMTTKRGKICGGTLSALCYGDGSAIRRSAIGAAIG